MKIISWNVNGVRAVAKKGLGEFLNSHQPDLFCIQETKISDELIDQSLRNIWTCANEPSVECQQYWFCGERKGYSGVATFSKVPTLDESKGFGVDEFDREGRVLITEHEDFLLYNIYFPNGNMNEERLKYKEEFNRQLSEHLQNVLDEENSVIVVGDYNIAHTEADIYAPEKYTDQSGFLPTEREWFSEFLELGFVDTFRYANPEEDQKFTWWPYQMRARVGNRGWRIDYICVSEDLIEHVTRAEILDDVEGSDHCPVLIEIDI